MAGGYETREPRHPRGESVTIIRSPGFDTLAELMDWFAERRAVQVVIYRGPDRTWRGSARVA